MTTRSLLARLLARLLPRLRAGLALLLALCALGTPLSGLAQGLSES